MSAGRNIRCIFVDAATGFIVNRQSLPPRLFPPAIPEGQRLVVPADRKIPTGPARLDLRKVRQPINHVASIDDVMAIWRPAAPSEAHRLDFERAKAIDALDGCFAARINAARGPMAAIHAEKRRQAEAGGGPLVADADDGAAILANAAREDEALAAIERERRKAKALLRAAKTEAELRGALATIEADGLKK